MDKSINLLFMCFPVFQTLLFKVTTNKARFKLFPPICNNLTYFRKNAREQAVESSEKQNFSTASAEFYFFIIVP